MKRALFAVLSCSLALFATYWFVPLSAFGIGDRLAVVRITPDGNEISDLRQIVFEFDRPVVPLGEMKRESKDIPIVIMPQVQCEWRWLNQTTLSCNLDAKNALHEATKYQIDVKPGLVAMDKSTMDASYTHAFTTRLPAVEYARVELWKSPTHAKIRVTTNQAVTQGALQTVLSFVSANGTRLSEVTITEYVELDWRGKPIEDYKHRVWDIEPASALPPSTSVQLHLMAGLVSLNGPAPSQESSTLVDFDTFDAFSPVGIECRDSSGDVIRIAANESGSLCNPRGGISILFNAPVAPRDVYKILEIAPSVPGLGVSDDEEDSSAYELFNALSRNHTSADVYGIPLPRLKPWQQYRISLKKDAKGGVSLIDGFERPLSKTMTMTFATDHLGPSYRLPYQYVVLEQDSESDLSVDLTNMQYFKLDYFGIGASGEIKKQSISQNAPVGQDRTFSIPLKIRELLNHQSGAIRAEFRTNLHNSEAYPDILFAEVTPFQVHFKIGHFSSLAWVTELTTGKVVPGAKVSLFSDTLATMGQSHKILATALTDSSGIAMLPGTSVIDPYLSLQSWSDEVPHMFVRVDKGGQMALLPAINEFETSSYRASNGAVYDNTREQGRHAMAWGTTAQGVHRLGDQVRYKIYVREQNNEALKAPKRDGYGLEVTDPMGKKVHELPKLTLNKFGAFDGEFTVPRNGAVGYYNFALKMPEGRELHTMSVLVSDFTPAPFNVSQEIAGQSFEGGQTAKVTTRAHLHSGGAFGGAQARVTATIERTGFYPSSSATKGFEFASSRDQESSKQVFETTATLGKNGELVSQIALPTLGAYSGSLNVESSVQDDRGKSISAFSSAHYFTVDRFVGLKNSDSMVKAGKALNVDFVVVDSSGKLMPGITVAMTLERQQNTLARIKDVGNTYTTHVATTWNKEGSCAGISGEKAHSCRFAPKVAGVYRATATIKDTKGREHVTETTIWVAGRHHVVWEDKNENFLDIIAEKREAVVGETARFFIKNPYPNSQALITVERYGVLDRFVKTLTSSSEIIEIPVKASYSPGFYLSVTIQSPRVAKAPKSGLDLGKPTFSMGYIDVPVVDRYKEITVTAKTELEVYRPRDKVKVLLHAQPKVAGQKAEPMELAVAVVDEAVFDLLAGGADNYDAYRGLYQFQSLDLKNYSLLTRLITRQAVETKGANPGGGGGGGVDIPARSNFKLLSYWNPSVVTDAKGNAHVEFEAPDNLTGWRVIAMAVTPSDKAGFGMGKFKVNRPTEIRPAMPNQCVEGDTLAANFTVMNRSESAREVKVSIQATGDVEGSGAYNTLVKLAPYERQTVSMTVKAKTLAMSREVQQGSIRFVVKAGDAIDTDALEHSLSVEKYRSPETSAVYGTTIEELALVDLLIPKNIFTDVGSLDVNLSTSVIASVEGAFRYMRDYPYSCWEQRLTKAVMAENYQRLKAYIPQTFKWDNSAALAQETLKTAGDFQAPGGGMAYFVPNDFYADSYLSAYTALAFNWMHKTGKKIPELVEARLHNYLLELLRRDTVPEHYGEAMTASVRATALFALAQNGKVTLADLTRVEPKFGVMGLFGQSHFVQAALLVPGAEQIAQTRLKEMMGKTTQTSGKFLFSDGGGSEFGRILSSELRSNCSALDMLVSVAKKDGMDKVGDVPMKLVRSISQSRQGREHYENTQENMFCMQALANYASVYEATTPNMKVSVRLDKEEFGKASFVSKTAQPTSVSRLIQKGDEGRAAKIEIERKGQGRLYYAASLTTASRDAGKTSVNAGMSLKREYSVWRDKKWMVQAAPVKLKRGDVVKVDLHLSLPRTGNFVVVNDPIPGALEPINSALANASSYGEVQSDGFYHTELLNNVARFYSDYLSEGDYHLSYTAQVIAEGTFTAMPPMAQEMYDPDVLGKDVMVTLEVAK